MATGCVVLASDVAPVREVIEPGGTASLEPLFDIDRLTETALRVLDDPAAFAPLGQAARATIQEKYRSRSAFHRWVSFSSVSPRPGRAV